MAYTDGKAAARVTPASDRVFPAPAPASRSNQEKTQGQSAKFHKYPLSTGASNQLRFDTVGKGLNVAGVPSSIPSQSKVKPYPAVENPSK